MLHYITIRDNMNPIWKHKVIVAVNFDFVVPNPALIFKLSMARICFIPIASVTHLCRLHNLERKVKPFPEGRQHIGHTRKVPETVPITDKHP